MLEIVYQDEYMVAINKPSGLLVHRSMIDRHETKFAMQMLRDQLGQHVYPVHRLDRPTSGILLFALSSDTARLLSQLFEQQQIKKRYRALVRGYLRQAGRLDYPLKEELDKIADKHAQQDKEPQSAVTDYLPLRYFELPFAVGRYQSARYSLVELVPKTGRKHQLRRHMAHLNHPITGDTTHGDGKHNQFLRNEFDLKGLSLTCVSLTLPHPVTGDVLDLECDMGPSIVGLLNQWNEFAVVLVEN
jgi:tRNA pseudouridine65 synthase